MPSLTGRVLEKSLAHLAATLEQAGQTHRNALASALLQSLDPRVKVIGAALLTIAAVSSRHLEIVVAILFLLTALAKLSQISWKRLFAAWAGGLFFAALVAVPAIFVSGPIAALLLICRSETSLTCWLLVVMTTPFNRVLRALRTLYVPVAFVAIISMTFRYIFLLIETAQDMLLSRRSRIVGRLTGADNRRLLVSTTGALLGKSIQLSDDVYNAMTSRGFRGEIQLLDDFHMTTQDWLALALVITLSTAAFSGGQMTPLPIFEAENLHYSYGQISALNGLNLSIAEGERIAFLGANGSGKSTLLRILDALYFPSSGLLRYQGNALTEPMFEQASFAFQFRRDVALVFQNPDVQLFCPTVYEEIAFGPLQMKWPRDTIRAKVQETLELLKITHLADRIPHHLSGGEKKKVALASALILDPKVILLDEPAAALDPRSQMQIIDFLTEWGSQSKTIITATHDLHTLEDIADKCVVFESGTIIAAGSPHDILHDQHLLQRSNLMHTHRRSRATGHIHPTD